MDKMETRKALFCVWDKDSIVELARGLANYGYEITANRECAEFLRAKDINVTEISALTGIPEIIGGRVKALHPAIMGGILARRGWSDDMSERDKYNIPLIDIVVASPKPVDEVVKYAQFDKIVDAIDTEASALIRAAAKNYFHVAVLTETEDYERLLDELDRKQEIPLEFRQELAIKAFKASASYDAEIYRVLCCELGLSDNAPSIW